MSSKTPVIDLASQLIQCPSITPEDHGCQAIIAERLKKLGFNIEQWVVEGTHNLLAQIGHGKPYLMFAGHTDVVPPGPLEQWSSPPFEPSLRYGNLYGRGACDMKGAIAAFITATEAFMQQNPTPQGTLFIALTSDEEGPAQHGMIEIIKKLKHKKTDIDYCLIGEPTSVKHLGDGIKIGRRGSLNGFARLHSTQGHVAYLPSLDNPLHQLGNLINNLISIQTEKPHPHFPTTSFQITHLHAGDGTTNVIPGDINIQFNFRYAPSDSHLSLISKVDKCFHQSGLEYSITWDHSAQPYHSPPGKLAELVSQAIEKITEAKPNVNTEGGTSDGRFLIDLECEIVEFGLSNQTIHQINEKTKTDDLIQLTEIYQIILQALLTN